MKPPRSLYIVALLFTILVVGFFHFGRPIWGPVKVRLVGGKTVATVLTKLDGTMPSRIPNSRGLTDGRPIALLAFKEERRLELWKSVDDKWRHIKDYRFTAYSGCLGPKLREGDEQIPEGIYRIVSLNPNSSYYLSMRLNYPNEFDREKAKMDHRSQLGGDIYIHGMSATIGCIPLGNRNIEEVFYLVAKNGYTNTVVIISPYDMRRGRHDSEIEAIEWERELYDSIQARLREFVETSNTPTAKP